MGKLGQRMWRGYCCNKRVFEQFGVRQVVIPHTGFLAFVGAVSPRWSRIDAEIAVKPLPQSDGRRSGNHLIDATLHGAIQ